MFYNWIILHVFAASPVVSQTTVADWQDSNDTAASTNVTEGSVSLLQI